MSCISVSTRRVGGVGISTLYMGGINLTIGIICDVGARKYLLVIPEDAQWIEVDASIDYNVLSNTNWLVN